jgi:hypothetical protein
MLLGSTTRSSWPGVQAAPLPFALKLRALSTAADESAKAARLAMVHELERDQHKAAERVCLLLSPTHTRSL